MTVVQSSQEGALGSVACVCALWAVRAWPPQHHFWVAQQEGPFPWELRQKRWVLSPGAEGKEIFLPPRPGSHPGIRG